MMAYTKDTVVVSNKSEATGHDQRIGYAWLPNLLHTVSPNFDARPTGIPISLLVIHAISLPPNQFSGDAVTNFFQNRLDSSAHPYFAQIADLRVSSHLFIRRNGMALQFVALDQRAWHAGVSQFGQQTDCNDFSIGIELEGSDTQPFELAQYTTLVQLTKQIQAHYPLITPARIVGHSDIAPGRKTDPGPYFKWADYLGQL